MPILPKGQKLNSLTIGGSPRGWTFISTAQCWWRFLQRYVVGIFPAGTKDYFDLGSAFHMLMEGQGIEAVKAEFPEHVTEATRLYNIRMSKGPPLGEAKAVEVEHAIFNGKMTSKPDREEDGLARDYKTAFKFSEHDDKKWGINGGIVGEAVALDVKRVLVDIVHKGEGKNEHEAVDRPVKVVDAFITDAKKAGLKEHVEDFWRQLEWRVARVAKDGEKLEAAFSKNLAACVGDYGPCDYYERCWGKPPESMMYRLAPNPPRRWVTGREDAPLKLPGKLKASAIEAVRTKFLKEKK